MLVCVVYDLFFTVSHAVIVRNKSMMMQRESMVYTFLDRHSKNLEQDVEIFPEFMNL